MGLGRLLTRLRDRLERRGPYVSLPVRRDDGGPPAFEELDVAPLGPNRYRLLASPGMVEGLARDDEFALDPASPSGFRVLKRSRLVCVWFYFPAIGQNRGPDGDAVRAAVEAAGGLCDGGGNTHLILALPVRLGFPAIEALFARLAAQHAGATWGFGNVYDPADGITPLDWWRDPPSA